MIDTVLALSLLAVVTCFATTVQTLVGFGFALIVMPVATLILGVRTAAPLVALTALTLYLVNIVRYRESLNLDEVWRLGVAAVVGVPVGVWGFARVSASFLKGFLGLLLIGYALHGLLHSRPLQGCSPRWAYLAGFLAGSLGGAYNTPGPPLALYGALRQWPKNEFRAGLQTLFFVSGTLTVVSHAVASHLTAVVLRLYAGTPLALLSGMLIGIWADRYVDKKRFRIGVLVLILLLGLSLVLNLGPR
jgi:hypothetical protein